MIAALRKWFAEEVRLMALDSWDGQYAGPDPCSHSDPACQALAAKQAEAREKMIAARIVPIERRRNVPSAAATDLAATFAAIRRVDTPPVQLVRRKAK